MLSFALTGAWAQDTTPPAGEENPQSSSQEPAPAYGQENAPPPIAENPPLSGLDLPSLEPHAAPLSYLQPGGTVSESAETNAGNTVGGGGVTSVSRVLGSLLLRRLWSNYDLALDYVGGVSYYSLQGQGVKALQQADVDQRVMWKRTQLSVRDSFSYLPEGNFGGSYGSLGSQGAGSLGTSGLGSFFGGSSLGNLGLAPRILNVSLADVAENLTPKSVITAAGGYAFSHYFGTDVNGTSFIGSSQITAQVGYNRLMSIHTQVALVYGYQAFDFSVTGTAFHTQLIQGMYGHRITGRMDLLIAAGPQITSIDTQSAECSDPTISLFLCTAFGDTLNSVPYKTTKLGVAGQIRLRYKFPKSMLDLSVQRYQTSGSGLFTGTQSDIARASLSRPLSRVWTGFLDAGFAKNSRLQALTPQQVLACSGPRLPTSQDACPANNANSNAYGFAGLGMHRAMGRDFHMYFSYQFHELFFNKSYCLTDTPCNRISNRSIATIGLDWTPRPIRID